MSDFYKYPRTFHLPWSLGSTSDDKILQDISFFEGSECVWTEKMDGENTSLYEPKLHARSLDSNDHPSRHWVKGLWAQIRYEIPEGWRICGENLFAKHSLYYDNLPSYFMVFSIWDQNNTCLGWDETKSYCEMLGLQTVPEIGRGTFNELKLRELAHKMDLTTKEGYVVRKINSFHYDDFSNNLAKFVRAKHVTTDQHWMHQVVIPNKLSL